MRSSHASFNMRVHIQLSLSLQVDVLSAKASAILLRVPAKASVKVRSALTCLSVYQDQPCQLHVKELSGSLLGITQVQSF
eukprot:m.102694 g.102694  ORF g.102694 m.102694 type:complete len:80 (-) comp15192_c0_seq2:799-1038(-)